MRERNSLTFGVVEVPPDERSLDGLLDFIADLLVRKWREGGKVRSEKDHETDDSENSMRLEDASGEKVFHV